MGSSLKTKASKNNYTKQRLTTLITNSSALFTSVLLETVFVQSAWLKLHNSLFSNSYTPFRTVQQTYREHFYTFYGSTIMKMDLIEIFRQITDNLKRLLGLMDGYMCRAFMDLNQKDGKACGNSIKIMTLGFYRFFPVIEMDKCYWCVLVLIQHFPFLVSIFYDRRHPSKYILFPHFFIIFCFVFSIQWIRIIHSTNVLIIMKSIKCIQKHLFLSALKQNSITKFNLVWSVSISKWNHLINAKTNQIFKSCI